MSKQVVDGIDPDVKVPAAVKAASARSADIHKQIYNPEPPAPPEAPETPDAPEIVPDITSVAAPETPPTPLEAPPAATTPPRDWENDYRSMKGRFDRAEAQNRAMADQIAQLQELVASLQERPPAPAAPDTFEKLITPEEENDYGQDFLNVVGKRAKETITPEVAVLRQELAELKNKLSGFDRRVSGDARGRLLDTLDDRVGNWREINAKPEFISWLSLPDTYSGVIRHELLKKAFDENDTPRVLAFFNGFLSEEAAVAPPRSEPDPIPTGKVPLGDLAAPGRAKTAAGSSSPPAEKPVFTRAHIASFYVDVRAGKYRGMDAEKERLEREIFAAQQDGRIR